MKNTEEWKELIEEVMGTEVVYNDKVSIFAEHPSGYVVIESTGNGLQLQLRRSLDHGDIVVAEDVVINGRIVSALVPSNHDDVKKTFSEFVEKL